MNIHPAKEDISYNAYFWAHSDTITLATALPSQEPGRGIPSRSTRTAGSVLPWRNRRTAATASFPTGLAKKPQSPRPCRPGEPDAVISLDALEPYEVPAVSVEPRVGDYTGIYEKRLENWNYDGHNVVVYRATDGTINADIRNGDSGFG